MLLGANFVVFGIWLPQTMAQVEFDARAMIAVIGIGPLVLLPALLDNFDPRPALIVSAEGMKLRYGAFLRWEEIENVQLRHLSVGRNGAANELLVLPPPPRRSGLTGRILDVMRPRNSINFDIVRNASGAMDAVARHAPDSVFSGEHIDENSPLADPLSRRLKNIPTENEIAEK